MTYRGVGGRIRERLLALGYRREDGEPDVQRFCWDHRFDKTLVYLWLRDARTPFKELIRLCTVLGCSAEWLLIGHERGKASPRQGRGRVRSWLLAVAVGAALWPSASVAGQARPLYSGLAAAEWADYVNLKGWLWRHFRYFGLGPAFAV